MTEKERMEAGLLYDTGAEEIFEEQRPYGDMLKKFNDLLPSQYEEQQRYMKEVFAEADAVLCPAMSASSLPQYDLADTFERTKKELLFTAVPNLTGIPALVTGGIQLWSAAFGENVLLSIASNTERMAD